MGMGKYNHSKFVFSETFNNRDGKTSGSGFGGIILLLVGAACFISAMAGYFMQLPNTLEVMGKIIIVLTLGASLLGVRKFVGGKDQISVGDEPAGGETPVEKG